MSCSDRSVDQYASDAPGEDGYGGVCAGQIDYETEGLQLPRGRHSTIVGLLVCRESGCRASSLRVRVFGRGQRRLHI